MRSQLTDSTCFARVISDAKVYRKGSIASKPVTFEDRGGDVSDRLSGNTVISVCNTFVATALCIVLSRQELRRPLLSNKGR